MDVNEMRVGRWYWDSARACKVLVTQIEETFGGLISCRGVLEDMKAVDISPVYLSDTGLNLATDRNEGDFSDPVKDNGEKRTFASGYQRDTANGKPRLMLILKAWYGLCAINHRFEEGAGRYGADNWRKGAPLSTFAESAARHLMKAIAGFKDENHWEAAGWNILCLLDTAKRIELGELPKELDDIGFLSVD